MAVHVILRIVHLFATLLALSLALLAYERTVEPIYGSGPTGYYLSQSLYGITTIAYFLPSPSISTAHLVLGILLCAAPTTAYRLAMITARFKNPVWGPAITHALVLVPIFYAGLSLNINVSIDLAPEFYITILLD